LAADARPLWPKPLRNFARASSLAHLQVMDFFSRGHMLADCRGDHRLARHRVRGDRSLTTCPPLA
jgi:hypothetical protein